MKKILTVILAILLLAFNVAAQNSSSTQTTTSPNPTPEVKKRPPVFRATKDQVSQAQKILKEKGHYSGEMTGSLNDETRAGLRKFQEVEKLKVTGTLNRVTLEKMSISLTEAQLKIPVAPDKPETTSSKEKKPRAPVFRATKDQIMQAQKMLKEKLMFEGEATGKMDDLFRTALKKYQEVEKLKVTGTMSRETVEKMGIPLTEKQKAMQTVTPATK